MSTNPSAALEIRETAQKRTQTEQFAFDIEAPDSSTSPTKATKTPQSTNTL